MHVKMTKKAFTVVELLTVIAIISILIGMLVPTLYVAKKMAMDARQRAQFASMDQAIMAYREQFGDYPDSTFAGTLFSDFGTRKLTEALVGFDLMGVHPASQFLPDGISNIPVPNFEIYNVAANPTTLDERKGPYIDPLEANAFKLGDLFDPSTLSTLNSAANAFVICDSYKVKKVSIPNPLRPTENIVSTAGTPILYFKANTAYKTLIGDQALRTYNVFENLSLMRLNSMMDRNVVHPILTNADGNIDNSQDYDKFYESIADPRILDATGLLMPYKADSYIMISAGTDGLYGTKDDIYNFSK